jgi:hypothetical protein
MFAMRLRHWLIWLTKNLACRLLTIVKTIDQGGDNEI